MAENLKVEHLNDGTALAQFTDEHDWEQANSTTNGGFGYYDGDATNKDKYGVLYDKKAASKKKLCPTGWRVADADDWNNLIEFVGGDNAEASAKLRAITGWQSLPNVEHVDGTDVYGFNAQPSGTFDSRMEIFENLLYDAYYWTDDNQYVLLRTDRLKQNFDNIGEIMNDGLSVRCVKD